MPESTPTSRWYHLSPDRLIGGLLAIEGFLFLSERFQWFAFNEKKGYTVLIAVAAVGLVVVVMLVWLLVSLLFHWRFQFSVRSLVVLVVVVAIPCCWLPVKMREAERQRKEVEAIHRAWLGEVLYDYQLDESGMYTAKQGPPAPAWLRELLREEFFSEVVGVRWMRAREVDVLLKDINGLSLIHLDLSNAQVTDEHLKELTKLRTLILPRTQVTDAGLEHLKGLRELVYLSLAFTQVTDAGLEHLKGLRELKRLGLSGTHVTDAGLEHLLGLPQLEQLNLAGTKVTDTGLEHLKGLKKLNWLGLINTQVTEEGIKELGKALPNCQIDWRFPTTPKTNLDQP